jgi:hypothetical protein
MISKPNPSPLQLLSLLQDAIRDAPALEYQVPLTETDRKWLGRVDATLDASGHVNASVNFRSARNQLDSYQHSRDAVLMPLYDVYSRMELLVPESMQGAFIPPGDTWNGYAAIVKLLQTECDDILIVDPYLNADIYQYFAPHSSAKNGLRCLAVQQQTYHQGLLASASKWAIDNISKSHHVEVRYAKTGTLHDRLIFIDGKATWLISQSIKDIAKKSAASVTRIDAELGEMKWLHYQQLWALGTAL